MDVRRSIVIGRHDPVADGSSRNLQRDLWHKKERKRNVFLPRGLASSAGILSFSGWNEYAKVA